MANSGKHLSILIHPKQNNCNKLNSIYRLLNQQEFRSSYKILFSWYRYSTSIAILNHSISASKSSCKILFGWYIYSTYIAILYHSVSNIQIIIWQFCLTIVYASLFKPSVLTCIRLVNLLSAFRAATKLLCKEFKELPFITQYKTALK